MHRLAVLACVGIACFLLMDCAGKSTKGSRASGSPTGEDATASSHNAPEKPAPEPRAEADAAETGGAAGGASTAPVDGAEARVPSTPPGNPAPPTPGPGEVTGRVTYTGKVPRKFRKGFFKGPIAKTQVYRALVDAKGGIRDVVVWLESDAARKALATRKPVVAEMDQKDSIFAPYILVIPLGGKVRFLNSDAIAHNVNVKDGLFSVENRNLAMDTSFVADLGKKEGQFQVGCVIHTFMLAWVKVVPSPYFTTTGADGSFTVSGVPEGQYSVRIWHPALRAVSGDARPVSVPSSSQHGMALAMTRRR